MKNRQLQHQFLMLHCETDHTQITQIFALCILMRTFKNSMTIKLVLLNVIRMLLRVLYYYPISTGRKEYHTVNPIIFCAVFARRRRVKHTICLPQGKKKGTVIFGNSVPVQWNLRETLLLKPLNSFSNHQLLAVPVALPEELVPLQQLLN